MYQLLKYDYSAKISNFKLKQDQSSENHQQIISNYIQNGLFNKIKQNIKTDIKKQQNDKFNNLPPKSTQKVTKFIKKLNNFEVYSDIEFYNNDEFASEDQQTSNKLPEVTKKISKIYKKEKQRDDKTVNKVRRWLLYWLYQQNLPYQQKIQELINKKFQGTIKLKRELQYVQQTQQQVDPWTLIPRSQLIQGMEYINKYPVYKNMISYSNIPCIKFRIVYRKYLKKMDLPERDIDNIHLNYVLKIKQIQKFLTQFLKFPYQFNRLSQLEDINPQILKVLYDLTSKSFQLGSLVKDLRKRTHTRVQKQQEYTENIAQELLNIMKVRIEREFVDFFLVNPNEMFVSLQEFVSFLHKYQYEREEEEELFNEHEVNNNIEKNGHQ